MYDLIPVFQFFWLCKSILTEISEDTVPAKAKRCALPDIHLLPQPQIRHKAPQVTREGDLSFKTAQFHGVFLPGRISLPVVPVEFVIIYGNVLGKSQER